MKLFLGNYHEDSIFYGLDPRIKLLWLIGNLYLIFFKQDSWVLLLCLGLALVTSRVGKIPLREYGSLLKILLVIGIQLVVLQALLYPKGRVIGQILGLEIYLGGIFLGLNSFLVLLNLVFFCLQFTMWTSPEDLTQLLVKLHLPPKFAVLVGLALHFLPVMEKDLAAIYESQQARGLELSSFWQKVRGLLPIMLPLILKALKRGGEVALAMELKGYTRYTNRTFLHTITLTKLDYNAGFAISAYLCVVLYLSTIM